MVNDYIEVCDSQLDNPENNGETLCNKVNIRLEKCYNTQSECRDIGMFTKNICLMIRLPSEINFSEGLYV